MIIPAVLDKNFEEVKRKVSLVDKEATKIHVDVAEKPFVDNETFLDLDLVNSLETSADLELHLLVENPLDYIKPLDRVKSVIVHVESQNVKEAIDEAKKLGYEVGITLNPETPIEALAKFMGDADFVQFMTVRPGGQGRPFEASVLDKIRIFHLSTPGTRIQVDGGVDEDNLPILEEVGANDFVIGSRIFDPKKDFKHFVAIENREEGFKKPRPIKRIGFYGGADFQPGDEVYQDAFELAKKLTEIGYEIVNGGGPGVMRASTEGSHAAGGEVIAVTYHPSYKKLHYEGTDPENKFDEEIVTLDYFDRTKVMLQNTDVHIVFKGGVGTISEFGMTWASSWIHWEKRKPIILFGDFWHEILAAFKKGMVMEVPEEHLPVILSSCDDVIDFITSLSKPD